MPVTRTDVPNATVHSKKTGATRIPGGMLARLSIIVLSITLIGMSAGTAAQPGIDILMLMAGALGLTSYLGLENAVRRRDQLIAQLETERRQNRLAMRLHQHITIPPRNRARRMSKPTRGQQHYQYLAVAQSNRSTYK